MPIPERTAEVSTQVEGILARVAVVEGQVVRVGDLLIQLDDRLATANLASARAAEQRAMAALEKLRHGPRKEELEAARQNALQLSAVVRSLQAKLDALRPLHEKGDVSDVEYGQAQARVEAAEAQSAAAAVQVKLLEAGSREEDIAMAEAELAAARADLTAARLAVEFCTVTAPIDGVVVDLSVEIRRVGLTDRHARPVGGHVRAVRAGAHPQRAASTSPSRRADGRVVRSRRRRRDPRERRPPESAGRRRQRRRRRFHLSAKRRRCPASGPVLPNANLAAGTGECAGHPGCRRRRSRR